MKRDRTFGENVEPENSGSCAQFSISAIGQSTTLREMVCETQVEVVVGSDSQLVATVLREIIENAGYECRQAIGTVKLTETLAVTPKLRLLVLDGDLVGAAGRRTIEGVRNKNRNVRVVVTGMDPIDTSVFTRQGEEPVFSIGTSDFDRLLTLLRDPTLGLRFSYSKRRYW